MSLTKVTYAMIDSAPANVRDFGAVGDGVTNDIVAFNLALRSGRSVFIPRGTYLIEPDTTPGSPFGDFMLYIGDSGAVPLLQSDLNGLTVFGEGNESIIKLGDNVGAGKLLFGAGVNDALANMTFRDFAIDLNGPNNLQSSFSDPLRYNSAFYLFCKCDNMLFENLYIYDGSGSQWIRCGGDSALSTGANIKVINCRFNNFGIGIPNNFQQDVSVLYLEASGVWVQDCWFQNSDFTFDLSRGQTAIELHVPENAFISNNTFLYTQLPVLVASPYTAANNIIISDNTMVQCAYLASLDTAQFDQKNIQISTNIFTSTKASASSIIAIGAAGEAAKAREDIKISGNIITGFGNTNRIVNTITIEGAYLRSITIENNSVGGFLGSLLYFAGQVMNTGFCDITIKNNRLDSLGNVGGSIFPTTPSFIFVSPSSGTINTLTIDGTVLFNSALKNYSALGLYRLGGNINQLFIDGTESSVDPIYPEFTESSLVTLTRRIDAEGTQAFLPVAAAGIANQTLFLNSATSKLSYKDGAGVVHALY